MRLTRGAGVLLHPTSLPGGAGVGDLGRTARRFVDWLVGAGQSLWQVLPLVAIDEGGSPYNGLSAFAGNPLLIDLEALIHEGLLEEAGTEPAGDRVDYPRAIERKDAALARAHAAFREGAAPELRGELDRYRERHRDWLPDYALFRAIRASRGGAAWTAWDPGLRRREPRALEAARAELATVVERYELEQLLFDRQWRALRGYANERGVRIVGDLPIFVAHDSADVWAHPELFQLEEDGEPRVVSGVPPDYFSETGQRWGNPLYHWGRMRERGYRWWVQRFRRTLDWVDLVRMDHFRGFQAYWEIPAAEETAVHGEWREGPGRELFDALRAEVGVLPIIAEDLGLITEEVEALRDELGLPGMRVLQFGFDGDPENPHLPSNYPEHAVAYTGTHDNDTVIGWWRSAGPEERERATRLLPRTGEGLHWALVELVMASRAALAVAPMQDLLGLGSDARMNTPGTSRANWSWRLLPEQLSDETRGRLLERTRRTGRLTSTGRMP